MSKKRTSLSDKELFDILHQRRDRERVDPETPWTGRETWAVNELERRGKREGKIGKVKLAVTGAILTGFGYLIWRDGDKRK